MGPRNTGSEGGNSVRAYELMVIHDGELDDVQVQEELKDLRSRIEEVGTVADFDFGVAAGLHMKSTIKPRGIIRSLN